jgi:hypothetical protein
MRCFVLHTHQSIALTREHRIQLTSGCYRLLLVSNVDDRNVVGPPGLKTNEPCETRMAQLSPYQSFLAD